MHSFIHAVYIGFTSCQCVLRMAQGSGFRAHKEQSDAVPRSGRAQCEYDNESEFFGTPDR